MESKPPYIMFIAYFLRFCTYAKKYCIHSASSTRLQGMLIGRFLVGTGMGVGPPVASLYIAEVQRNILSWIMVSE